MEDYLVSEAIPRCAFIAWLAIRNRLSTKERSVNRGLAIDAVSNVQGYSESTSFLCAFSRRIWMRMKYGCCQESMGDDWDNIVE